MKSISDSVINKSKSVNESFPHISDINFKNLSESLHESKENEIILEPIEVKEKEQVQEKIQNQQAQTACYQRESKKISSSTELVFLSFFRFMFLRRDDCSFTVV